MTTRSCPAPLSEDARSTLRWRTAEDNHVVLLKLHSGNYAAIHQRFEDIQTGREAPPAAPHHLPVSFSSSKTAVQQQGPLLLTTVTKKHMLHSTQV